MAFVASNGVAAQDAILEGVEADDFVGVGVLSGYFVSFVSGGLVHLLFLALWMRGAQ